MKYPSICLSLLTALMAPVAFGQTAPHLTAADLTHLHLPEVTIDGTKPEGSHLTVNGTIGGHIHFELLLPNSWNGRFLMGGGGGFVGTVQNGARNFVEAGYATVGTDTGHQGQLSYSAAWAQTNLEAQVDFGYLAVHRTAIVARDIVSQYYGTNSAYSYFVGCSRGGGQAMMEAQRYPGDFDGIVAGAPAFNWTGIAAYSTTVARALYPDPKRLDQTALDLPALEKLEKGILAQCDARDGLKDGVVQDPPAARFDLAKVSGLTDQQRKDLATIYGGVHLDGALIYPGFTPGAECEPLQWKAWITGPVPLAPEVHSADLMFAFGTQIFKYLIMNDPNWDYSTYDFSNFARDTRVAASFLNATNANLDPLKARHGKLILWHGWADTALPAQATVDYYRQVQAHDAGAADYCRLFMVPGCLHCGGGPGATEVDWLGAIVKWVENGQAPDRLIAIKREHGKIKVTRPVYPYPQVAVYSGQGDAAEAASFKAIQPAPAN